MTYSQRRKAIQELIKVKFGFPDDAMVLIHDITPSDDSETDSYEAKGIMCSAGLEWIRLDFTITVPAGDLK